MSDFQFFMPIAKLDSAKRTVSGYASTPQKDSDGEIVTLDAVKQALPGYMEYGNIREMHALKAVGTTNEAHVDTKGLFITAKIVDDAAWAKCVEGVYKGFSIGGRKLAKTGNKITSIDMTEISIVDRPSNPGARFALAKSQKVINEEPGYLLKIKSKISPENKALAKMAKIVGSLAKGGPPAAHDGFSLPAKPDENPSPKDDSQQNNKADATSAPCEKHGKIACEKCAVEKAEGEKPCDAHGKMNCKECLGKREFSQKEREELASSGEALPDGSYPIKNVSDLKNAIQAFGRAKDKAKAKAHIMSRAKSLGATSELPEDWGKSKAKSKEAKKLAKAKLSAAFGINNNDTFLTLRKATSNGTVREAAPVIEIESLSLKKNMNTVGSLAYCFDSIRNAQRSLMMEAKREGGDMKDKGLALKLGAMAKDLAGIMSQKAEHEGSEATDFSDADDMYLSSLLGEDFDMEKINTGGSGDPLTDAVAALMKRAAQPTRMQRMEMAKADIDKSRKAAKMARKAVEDVHKMLKASYIAKAAKKDDKKEDNDDEFDHAEAMGKLQKAYQEIDKARTFGKAASAQMEKAAGRSGQRGQEVGDPEAGFYEVPPGVKDLTPAALAGATPGGVGSGSQPPMYPVDGGVYPGKAAGAGNNLQKYVKNGFVSADVAELLMQKAVADGELEALRRLPASPSGGRRPYAFDMTKVVAGQGGGTNTADLNKALFDGVDVNALNSPDERQRNEASAKVAGNFLMSGHFGKSLFDPSFHGAAGSAR